MTRDRLPLLAWLLMTIAAVALIIAQLDTSSVYEAAPAAAETITAPIQGTPTMLVVLVATQTPTATATKSPPTVTPWPTETPWPQCPQASGQCEWYWPTITPHAPQTPTPFPSCGTPIMGGRCVVVPSIGDMYG